MHISVIFVLKLHNPSPNNNRQIKIFIRKRIVLDCNLQERRLLLDMRYCLMKSQKLSKFCIWTGLFLILTNNISYLTTCTIVVLGNYGYIDIIIPTTYVT